MRRLSKRLPRRRPGRASGSAGLLLAAFFAAAPLAAATLELPAEWPLGTDSLLFFELDGADLYFTGRAQGLPVLRAWAATAGQDARLEVVSEGGSLAVRRPPGGEAEAPRLRIDVALGPGRAVRVAGADLSVRAEGGPASAGGNAFRLALERSTAVLSGARVSAVEAAASSLRLAGTEGALSLTLAGGSAQVQGHQGSLELRAAGAEVAVVGHQGHLAVDLEGGGLEIEGGEGVFEGTAGEAQLSFDGWQGPVELRASDSVVDVFGTEHRDRWQIEGRELQVVLERVRGRIGVNLIGGSLRGSDLAASVRASASGGTRLDLAEVVGGVKVSLADGAEARVAGVSGGLEAEVTDSRLEAERIDSLTLGGERAEVIAVSVAQLAPVAMTASQLDLDLRATRSGAALDLRGAGYARVWLAAPCVVRLAGAGEPAKAPVEVTGCELRAAGQQVSRRQESLELGGPASRLTVTASAEAIVEVEGDP